MGIIPAPAGADKRREMDCAPRRQEEGVRLGLTGLKGAIECLLMEDGQGQEVGATAPTAAARAGLMAAAAFLGVSRIWVGGYAFGAADESWQVPLVRGIASGEYLKDYIFNPPPRLSLFFPLAALPSHLVRLEYVYFAGYAAASIATAIGVYLLAQKMLASRPAAFLAVVLLLTGKDVAAGATTWDAYFLPRTAAMPFLIFSWWMMLEEKPGRAGVLMGVAFALHPLTGIYGGAIAVAATLLAGRETPGALARFAAGAAAPVIATALYVRGSAAPLWKAGEDWYQAMLVRNIHHIALGNFFVFAGLLAYALAAGVYAGISGGKARLLIGGTAVASVAFMYAAAAQLAGQAWGLEFPERALLDPPALALIQPLRVSGPLGILAIVATGAILWKAMQKGLVARFTAVGAVSALAADHSVTGIAFLAAAILAQTGARAVRTLAVAAGVGALAGTFAYNKGLFVLILGVAATAALAALSLKKTKFFGATATLVAAVVLLGIVPAGWAARAAQRTFGQATTSDAGKFRRQVAIEANGDAAMEEAARWIGANTKPSDVTIIPPWWEGFRVVAQRPAYGTYKDGSLAFFNEKLAGDWLDRMEALHVPLRVGGGPNLSEADRLSYATLTRADIVEASRRAPADYAVRFSDDLEGLEEAYSGSYVTIYKLEAPGERR